VSVAWLIVLNLLLTMLSQPSAWKSAAVESQESGAQPDFRPSFLLNGKNLLKITIAGPLVCGLGAIGRKWIG